MTTTTTLSDVAREARSYFYRIERGDEKIMTFRDDRPGWVHDLVYAAHGAFLPDDWRYEQVAGALDALDEADLDAADDAQETLNEWADSAVDTYTHGLLQWLASNPNRLNYCDDAAAEFGFDASATTLDRIGWGQYTEAMEIAHSVLTSLMKRLEAS